MCDRRSSYARSCCNERPFLMVRPLVPIVEPARFARALPAHIIIKIHGHNHTATSQPEHGMINMTPLNQQPITQTPYRGHACDRRSSFARSTRNQIVQCDSRHAGQHCNDAIQIIECVFRRPNNGVNDKDIVEQARYNVESGRLCQRLVESSVNELIGR